MAVIPVKVPPEREILVLFAGVGNISHQDVHVFLVLLKPLRVQVTEDSSSQNVVAVVKMVVIVKRIAKVRPCVARHVSCRGDDASPGVLLRQQRDSVGRCMEVTYFRSKGGISADWLQRPQRLLLVAPSQSLPAAGLPPCL